MNTENIEKNFNNNDLKGLTEQSEKLEQAFKNVCTSVDDAGTSFDRLAKEVSEKQSAVSTDLAGKAAKAAESASKSGQKSIIDGIKSFVSSTLTAMQKMVPLQTFGFIKIDNSIGK